MAKFKGVLLLLIEEKALPASYNDHPLKGDRKGFRDLHIEPDWLLLYRIVGGELQLARTGTRADPFDEWYQLAEALDASTLPLRAQS